MIAASLKFLLARAIILALISVPSVAASLETGTWWWMAGPVIVLLSWNWEWIMENSRL